MSTCCASGSSTLLTAHASPTAKAEPGNRSCSGTPRAPQPPRFRSGVGELLDRAGSCSPTSRCTATRRRPSTSRTTSTGQLAARRVHHRRRRCPPARRRQRAGRPLLLRAIQRGWLEPSRLILCRAPCTGRPRRLVGSVARLSASAGRADRAARGAHADAPARPRRARRRRCLAARQEPGERARTAMLESSERSLAWRRVISSWDSEVFRELIPPLREVTCPHAHPVGADARVAPMRAAEKPPTSSTRAPAHAPGNGHRARARRPGGVRGARDRRLPARTLTSRGS